MELNPAPPTSSTTEDPLEWSDFRDTLEEHFRDNDYIYILLLLGFIILIILYCFGKYCYIHCHLPNSLKINIRRRRNNDRDTPILQLQEIPDQAKFIDTNNQLNQLLPYRQAPYGQWRTTPNGIEVN
jgi:hypothetical protein